MGSTPAAAAASVWVTCGEHKVHRCPAGSPLSSPQGFLLGHNPGAAADGQAQAQSTPGRMLYFLYSLTYVIRTAVWLSTIRHDTRYVLFYMQP